MPPGSIWRVLCVRRNLPKMEILQAPTVLVQRSWEASLPLRAPQAGSSHRETRRYARSPRTMLSPTRRRISGAFLGACPELASSFRNRGEFTVSGGFDQGQHASPLAIQDIFLVLLIGTRQSSYVRRCSELTRRPCGISGTKAPLILRSGQAGTARRRGWLLAVFAIIL